MKPWCIRFFEIGKYPLLSDFTRIIAKKPTPEELLLWVVEQVRLKKLLIDYASIEKAKKDGTFKIWIQIKGLSHPSGFSVNLEEVTIDTFSPVESYLTNTDPYVRAQAKKCINRWRN